MTVLAIARRTAVLALAAFSLAACSGGSKSAVGPTRTRPWATPRPR